MWNVILTMLLLLILTPFELQVRFSTYSYPDVFLTDFVFYSWTWVYSVVGFGTTGFITRPFYQIAQTGSLQTFFPFLFLLTLIGYQLGALSSKDARNVGYASLLHGLVAMTVNLVLSILTPGSPSINAPIPLPLASILGILVLRREAIQQDSGTWLSES